MTPPIIRSTNSGGLAALTLALPALLGGCALAPVHIVQEQVRAYNARDLEWFVGLYSPDATIRNLITGEVIGEGESYFRERYSQRFTASPDLHATIHDRIVLGDYVIDSEEVVRRKSDPTVQALAIYRVSGGKITDVWFAFDHELNMDAAPMTHEAFVRHADAVRYRNLSSFKDTFTPNAQVMSFPDGGIVHADRDEIIAIAGPLLVGDSPLEWRLDDQIVFGNLVIAHEWQRIKGQSPWTDRVVIYEFADSRIRRCWVLSRND